MYPSKDSYSVTIRIHIHISSEAAQIYLEFSSVRHIIPHESCRVGSCAQVFPASHTVWSAVCALWVFFCLWNEPENSFPKSKIVLFSSYLYTQSKIHTALQMEIKWAFDWPGTKSKKNAQRSILLRFGILYVVEICLHTRIWSCADLANIPLCVTESFMNDTEWVLARECSGHVSHIVRTVWEVWSSSMSETRLKPPFRKCGTTFFSYCAVVVDGYYFIGIWFRITDDGFRPVSREIEAQTSDDA